MRTEKIRRRPVPAPLADEVYDYFASAVRGLPDVEMRPQDLEGTAQLVLVSPRRPTDVMTELVDVMAAGDVRVVFAVHGAAPRPWTRMRVYHVDEPLDEYTVSISHVPSVNGAAVGEHVRYAG